MHIFYRNQLQQNTISSIYFVTNSLQLFFINQRISNRKMSKHCWHKVQISTCSSSKPVPRWGHNCCIIGEQIAYFGGYADSNYMNDVWVFNTTNMTWRQIITTGDQPTNRSNCSMNYDAHNNQIIVFGGGGVNKQRFNTINILNWSNKEWIQICPKQNQTGPWERTYHSAELIYPYLVIYGGEGVADMDDTWLFNFNTLSWTEIVKDKTKDRPCARRFHSSVIVGNQFFVIAGCHGKYKCLSNIYSLDLSSLIESGRTDKLEWKERNVSGSSFLTRWGHTSTAYGDNVYIFGGRFSNDLNDILVFDTKNNTMKNLKIGSQLPQPRRRHCAGFIGSCLVTFGGFNGEYFNDLHYINIFEPKIKRLSCPDKNTSLTSYINNNEMSDITIQTKQNLKIHAHTGLAIKSFHSESHQSAFFSQINNQYTESQVIQILTALYKGYGAMNLKLQHKHGVIVHQNKREKEKQDRRKIDPSIEYGHQYIVKRTNFGGNSVIQLNQSHFREFLGNIREKGYSDCSLMINDHYRIRVNRMQLCANSKFFKNLLHKNYDEKNEVVRLQVPNDYLIMFEILLNYIVMNVVVVPESLSFESWMELCQLAEYFCLAKLKNICEIQISDKIGGATVDEIMKFSQELELGQLKTACADYEIKSMMETNNTEQILTEIGKKQQNFRAILTKIYCINRFDLFQITMSKVSHLKKSISEVTQAQKQNYQVNYN